LTTLGILRYAWIRETSEWSIHNMLASISTITILPLPVAILTMVDAGCARAFFE